MDPYICCLLGICCPPLTDQQREKLIAIRMKRGGCANHAEAEKVVAFDLSLVKSFLETMKAKSE